MSDHVYVPPASRTEGQNVPAVVPRIRHFVVPNPIVFVNALPINQLDTNVRLWQTNLHIAALASSAGDKKRMSIAAKTYITTVVLIGTCVTISELTRWESQDLVRFVCYLALSMPASRFKVALPAITGALSVPFIFILFGIVELSLPEALLHGLRGDADAVLVATAAAAEVASSSVQRVERRHRDRDRQLRLSFHAADQRVIWRPPSGCWSPPRCSLR